MSTFIRRAAQLEVDANVFERYLCIIYGVVKRHTLAYTLDASHRVHQLKTITKNFRKNYTCTSNIIINVISRSQSFW